MSLLTFEGFETAAVQQGWSHQSGGGAPTWQTAAAKVRSGLRGLEAYNTSGWTYQLPAGLTHFIVGVAYNVGDNNPGTSVTQALLAVMGSGGNWQGGGMIAGAGSGYSDTPNQFYIAGANGVLLGTIAHTWVVDGWQYFELRYKRATGDATNDGEIEFRVNGVQVFQNLACDNVYGVQTPASIQSHAGNNSYARWDDFYLINKDGVGLTDFLGTPRVNLLVPNGDGASEQWTPSSGTDSYAMVDETPGDDDTTYVESVTSGHRTSFTLPDLHPAVTTIHGIQVQTRARKTAGDPASMESYVRTGGVNYDSAAHALSEGYTPYSDIWEENPGTTNPWTPAEVDALEIGIEVT